MLTRGDDVDNRQNKLLKEIVESYIKNAKPVGSKSLCSKLKCSSATIRNEMATLENLGLLEKNHISSGRIPSERGYKYYVDNLMKPKELTGEDVLKLQTIFHNNALEVSDAITECVKIISEITNYTSIVLGKSSKDNELKQVSIIPLSDNKIVALVCTDKGIVENKQFTLSSNIYIDEVVKIIKTAKSDVEAKEKLMSRFGLTEIQTDSILELKLRRLTGLEREKIELELSDLLKEIEELKSILASEQKVLDIIKKELIEIKNKFGDERRTHIDMTAIDYIEDESLIPEE